MLPLNSARARPRVRRLLFWPLVAAAIAMGAPAPAHADQVSSLIAQLQSSGDYKVRLSAALNLTKMGDRRAVAVFIKALRDPDKTVRGVAAAGLGKLVNVSTSVELRGRATEALKQAAVRDENAFVRKQAQKAYDVLKSLGRGGAGVAIGATYVQIGAMAAATSDPGSMKALMRSAVEKTFRQKAPAMVVEWPGTGAPSAKQIRSRKVNAFFVDGTVNQIVVAGGLVECKVSMVLATYPAKSMFGFLKGGAKVEGGGDVVLASQDCVLAVVEDLIARKIIPTIEARTP